jgi:hypothetical protein
MIRDHTILICPLPGLGQCVRERCNFWDMDREECTCDCFDACDPVEAGSPGNPGGSCLISFIEDFD